jgi:hypothetical protein
MRTPRQRPRRFRFEASYPNRESLGVLLIQGVIQFFLIIALGLLSIVSIRMVRVHFLDSYGFQAWILPIITGLMTLFLLYRFIRFWRVILNEFREARETDEGK